MTARKRILVLILLASLLITSVFTLLPFAFISVNEIDLYWGKVTPETAEIRGIATIFNPSIIGIPLSNMVIDLRIFMNGIEAASGIKRGINFRAGESKINFSVFLDNKNIPKLWISHLRNNEKTTVDVKVHLFLDVSFWKIYLATFSKRITVETDILSNLQSNRSIEISIIGSFYIIVKSLSFSWGEITNEVTEISSNLTLYNPNMIPLTLSKIGFDIQANNITIGEGETSSSIILKPKSQAQIDLKAKIYNEMLDDWFVTHIKNGEVTVINIRFFSILKIGKTTLKIYLGDYSEKIKTSLLRSRK